MDYQIKLIIIYTSNNDFPDEANNGIEALKRELMMIVMNCYYQML